MRIFQNGRPINVEELAVRLLILPLLARLVHQGKDGRLLAISHLDCRALHIFTVKKSATILQHLHTEPVALIFILSTFLLFLLRRLPAHTSFDLRAEKMQHLSN